MSWLLTVLWGPGGSVSAPVTPVAVARVMHTADLHYVLHVWLKVLETERLLATFSVIWGYLKESQLNGYIDKWSQEGNNVPYYSSFATLTSRMFDSLLITPIRIRIG